MKEAEIDDLVFQALSSKAGQRFHQWLVNNYLMAIEPTLDPHQALFNNGQQTLVTALNTRFARHLERQEKQGVTDTGRPASGNARVRRHFQG